MPPDITMQQSTIERLGVSEVHKTFDGGQKYVFIATCNGIKCAVKMFKFGFGDREKRELAFYLEKKDLYGIPTVLEVINEGSETILVEEYIEGESLHDIAASYEGNPFEISRVIEGIASILDSVWTEGKVHRDIKPHNIIIRPDGTPVVLDFGIFKDPENSTITDTGFQPNSWPFAAPEQLLGKKEYISYRTDFFSLGVLAYCLYYQKLPFGNNKEEVISKMVGQDVSFRTDSNCELNGFFEATMKFDASERPRNVALLCEGVNTTPNPQLFAA